MDDSDHEIVHLLHPFHAREQKWVGSTTHQDGNDNDSKSRRRKKETAAAAFAIQSAKIREPNKPVF